ncbi:MAG TPA: 3'-5' exonuclease, partial [Microthrixaceae bacterium]|nr:3'-5' exonuclease [Microthrixaceae bacterium]
MFHVLFGSGEPRSTLVLVGDPKQAIYGFRGGDVYTYLAARKLVEPRVLGTNHRSVPQAVDSMNAIGAGQFFGEESIAYQPVDVAAQNRGKQLLIEGSSSSIGPDGCSGDDGGTRVGPGLQVRCLNGFHSFREYDTAPKSIPVEKYHRRIAEDLADVAVDLLNNGILADSAVGPQKLKPVRPADIAVLVGSGAAADPVMKALTRRGVASVKLIKDSVLASEAAEQWLTLLRAMERPADQRLAGAAALTWFFGWSADELAAAVDPRSRAANVELTEVQYQLAIWAEVLERSGVSALFAEARRTSGVVPRLLAQWQGDRNLTDLEHVAELIHTESTSRSVGLSAAQAIDVLDGWMQDVDDEEAIDAMQRRVESDDDSVRILTIHSAKGLEFPVVLLPDLAGGGNRVKTPSDLSYFDRDKGLRVLDVSTEQKASGETKKVSRAKLAPRAIAEAKRQGCGDQHRLTYVALTRATHLSVTWWAPLSGSSLTGLARLLFGVEGDAASDVAIKPPPPEEVFSKLRDRFDSLGAKDSIQVVNVPSELPSPARFDPLRAESLRSAVAHDPMRSRSEPNQAEGVSVTAGRSSTATESSVSATRWPSGLSSSRPAVTL